MLYNDLRDNVVPAIIRIKQIPIVKLLIRKYDGGFSPDFYVEK
jgi:hypothetical protein